jgi:hypothetical protein
MNRIAIILCVVAISCSSSTTSPSSTAHITLTPSGFSPAGTVLHIGDSYSFGATFSACCDQSFVLAIEFIRDDGAELLQVCAPGAKATGETDGDTRGTVPSLTSSSPLYSFGVGHTLNAAIGGGFFTSANVATNTPTTCPFSGSINWSQTKARVDVPLGWTILP